MRGPSEWGRSAPGTPDPGRTAPRRRPVPGRPGAPATPMSPDEGPRAFEMSVSGGRLSLVVAPDGPIRRMIQLTLLHLSLDVRTADGGR